MQVFRGIPERAGQSSVLTIGNFDGVHLWPSCALAPAHRQGPRPGTARHRADLRTASARVFRTRTGTATAHLPAREAAAARCLRRRLRLRGALQAAFAAHTAEQFIEDVLSRGLAYATSWSVTISASASSAGRFRDASASRETAALRRRGNADTRARRRAGFELGGAGGARGGRIDDAATLLGRPYSIAGRVVRGNRIGRTIGFPTANIQLKHRRTPLSGEFVVTIEGLGSEPRRGVANVGVRPSVSDSGKPMLEVKHLRLERRLLRRASADQLLHEAACRDEVRRAHRAQGPDCPRRHARPRVVRRQPKLNHRPEDFPHG